MKAPLLALFLVGCAGEGGYITHPDAAISTTVTQGGASLVGAERCTVTVTGALPRTLHYYYLHERCRVLLAPETQ